MAKTLHELAVKLQEYIISAQSDSHNSTNMVVAKYNNLKIKMNVKYKYPHVIVCIGISEAVYNLNDCTKTDGGIGSDEKYVRKWLGNGSILEDLKENYISMFGLISVEDDLKETKQEDEGVAGDAQYDAPRQRDEEKIEKLINGEEEQEEELPEDFEGIKQVKKATPFANNKIKIVKREEY